jgi:hypothetical protein
MSRPVLTAKIMKVNGGYSWEIKVNRSTPLARSKTDVYAGKYVYKFQDDAYSEMVRVLRSL